MLTALLTLCLVTAAAADPYTLTPGQTQKVNENTTVTFKAVTDDSRCPANVQCIWAGEATVSLTLTKAGVSSLATLSTDSNRTAEVSGLTIRLDALLPDPPPAQSAKDYRLTLTIEPSPASPSSAPASSAPPAQPASPAAAPAGSPDPASP